jgi:hypothetical protein
MLIVYQANRILRLCIWYRGFNESPITYRYLCALQSETMNNLGMVKLFMTLWIYRANNRIQIRDYET